MPQPHMRCYCINIWIWCHTGPSQLLVDVYECFCLLLNFFNKNKQNPHMEDTESLQIVEPMKRRRKNLIIKKNHVSHVMCHLPHVTYLWSPVTCHQA